MHASEALLLDLILVNVVFMAAGIFLNIIIVLSFYRSSQLQKKVSYFMILVLSCSDLSVVSVVHPLLISSIVSAYLGNEKKSLEFARVGATVFVESLSLNALVALSIERFLALSYPFLHQTSVSKRRLIYLLIILIILGLVVAVATLYPSTLVTAMSLVYLAVFLALMTFLNYKIFAIAKSKRKNTVAPSRDDKNRSKVPLRKSSKLLSSGYLFLPLFLPISRILY